MKLTETQLATLGRILAVHPTAWINAPFFKISRHMAETLRAARFLKTKYDGPRGQRTMFVKLTAEGRRKAVEKGVAIANKDVQVVERS